MEAKAIKISPSNYREICEFAGELQQEVGEPVSIDRAITFLLHRNKLSDLAGSWTMSDKEAESFMEDLHKGWSKWKIKSA